MRTKAYNVSGSLTKATAKCLAVSATNQFMRTLHWINFGSQKKNWELWIVKILPWFLTKSDADLLHWFILKHSPDIKVSV